MSDEEKLCAPLANKSYSGGFFNGNDPLDDVFPLILLQGALIFLTSRVIHYFLKPLKQPKIISEILGGIVLGPSLLGRNNAFREELFPPVPMTVVSTISRIGIIYFIFIATVKMDKDMMLSTIKNVWNLGLTGFMFPFTMTTVMTHYLHSYIPGTSWKYFIFILSSNLSVTYFAVVSHTLNELNLLNSELGQLAMSVAFIKDVIGWILLAVTSVIVNQGDSSQQIIASKLSILAVGLFAFFVLRPAIRWIIRTTPEGKPVRQIYLVAIMIAPLIMGIVTEMFDKSYVPGALMMGLIIPAGPPLGSILVEKCELVIFQLFIPSMFVRIGRYTDIYSITNWKAFVSINLIMIGSYIGKTIGTVLAMLFLKSGLQTAIILSLILNIKGLVDFIIILRWRTINKIIDDQFFTILVLAHTIQTAIVTPLISILYRPKARLLELARSTDIRMRTLQTTPLESELRILCGLHYEDNVHSFITLLKASNTSETSPICAYVVHLVELTGRSAPVLLPYDTHKKKGLASNSTDRIMRAVMKYSKTSSVPITIQPFKIIAPYNTMHEDICSLIEDRYIPLVVLPFHSYQESCGRLTSLRNFNLNMQAYSPCTVGILVDRGMPRSLNSTQFSFNVGVFFLGGPDDREAMALVSRVSRHPDVSITLFRIFLVGEQGNDESEKRLDDGVINEFLARNTGNACVVCREMVAKNTTHLVEFIRRAEKNYDLLIVGKRRGPESQLEKELTPWVENEELGIIGDMMATADFCCGLKSVLVIQCFGNFSANVTDMASEISFFSSRGKSEVNQ